MTRIAALCAGCACLFLAGMPALAAPAAVTSRQTGEALVAAAPGDVDACLAYATWLTSAGELQEAAAVLEAGCHRVDAPGQALLALADVYLKLGKLTRAEAAAREALVLLPDSPAAHLCIGDIYRDLDWPQSALDSYETALKLAPGLTQARVNLVAVLAKSGRSVEARERCLAFIDATPGEPQLWLSLGQVFEDQDKPREAFTTYGQVISLDATSAEAWARQGRLYCRFGQFASAADACRRALEIDGGNLVAHAWLGTACSYLGDQDQARRHAQIAEAGGMDMSGVWRKLNQ
jgi:tetratricopeptide (TPR) repeat protein